MSLRPTKPRIPLPPRNHLAPPDRRTQAACPWAKDDAALPTLSASSRIAHAFAQIASAGSVFLAAALLLAGQMLLSTNLTLRLSAEGLAAGTISLVMIHNSLGIMLGPTTVRA